LTETQSDEESRDVEGGEGGGKRRRNVAACEGVWMRCAEIGAGALWDSGTTSPRAGRDIEFQKIC